MASGRRSGSSSLLQPERTTAKIDFSEKYSTESLKGQSVLVTGGATGIGQGSTVAFAEAGALVTIADINETDAKKTVDELTAKGLKIQFIKTDVTKWDQLVASFKSAIKFGGGLDIVMAAAGISNAGAGNGRWLEKGGKDENGDPLPVPTKVLAVNGDAVFNTAHLAMYYFKQNPTPVERSKQIIFVASMAGYSSMTGVMDYATSKWAVRGLFRSLRGAYGILGEGAPDLRCNLLAPGFILTPMTQEFAPFLQKLGVKFALPEDVARVVLRMASDKNVIGRACAIAPEGKSFDLCDDAEGLEAGRELNLAVTENRFGYPGPPTEAEEKRVMAELLTKNVEVV